MRKVVVGAAGTLGATLVDRLGAVGVEMRCSQPHSMTGVAHVRDADVVVNVGGPRVRPGLAWHDYFREHVGVTTAIARAMRPGARLVHVSTTAVWGARGATPDRHPRETPTRFPSRAYACAKLAAETTARALGRERGVQVRVLRPSIVYGPRVDSVLETIRKLARRGVRLMLAPGRGRQQLAHVDLLVRAVDRAMAAPIDPAEDPLVVADPFVLTNADLVARAGGVPVVVDVRAALALHAVVSRVLGSSPGALEALAVLGLDNVFDVEPTWRALGIDAGEFARERTFDPYWSGVS